MFLRALEFLLNYKDVFSYVIFGLLCLALVVFIAMSILFIWWVSSKDSPFGEQLLTSCQAGGRLDLFVSMFSQKFCKFCRGVRFLCVCVW